MVHALREAQRVLQPNGLLLDLRPAAVHRRVGLARGRRWLPIAPMRERFDNDRAANRAVAQVVAQGLFRLEARRQFEVWRQMDTLEEFRAWLADFPQPHAWLVPRVAEALAARRVPWKIVVTAPVVLQVLRKPGAAPANEAGR
jgi:hypothetical protein